MATWAALHLFAQCRYTRRLWTELGASVPTATANMASWDTCESTAQWWKVASASTNYHLRRCDHFCCSFVGKFGMKGMKESSDTKSPRS